MTEEVKTAVATTASGGALATSALARMAKAKHVDEFKSNELLIPWLKRVSGTSSVLKRNKPEYIEGAKIGDIVDTLTMKLRSSQTVILVKYETHYTTFAPGGGKVLKQWFTDRSAYDAASFPPGKSIGKKIDAEGNEVVESPMYYILACDMQTGAALPMCMSWGSTQAKKTKRLNALAKADMFVPTEMENGEIVEMPFSPPLYARLFDIRTVDEANAEHSWVGWAFDVGPAVLATPKWGEMWYAKAEAFRDQIEKGAVRPMDDEHEQDDASSEGGSRPQRQHSQPARAVNDEEIPF